jgi:molybdopterin/thiamine biosynthesis adenylyltransferase
VSTALGARDVLVAGLGSVGSYVAEQLVRAGIGGLALVDPEQVEAANLSRSAYEAADVGHPKVEALAGRLFRVQPALRLALHARAVQDLPPQALDAAIRAAHLVIAATDDPAAQRALDRFAYARGRPALFVGLYAGAQGGEIVMTVPERTPCYLCATRTRLGAERAGGAVSTEVDYGTARLRAEIALGADVHHVASAAVKLALSLLLGPGDGASLASFAEAALADGTPFLTLSTVPEYWFYPQVFGETPGQGAYQSVWLTPSRAPECPVCGDPANRVDPLDVPARPPRREALAALRDGGLPPGGRG